MVRAMIKAPRVIYYFASLSPHRWKVFKGDKVEVISGPEKGKQGTVLKVLREKNRVIIEGVNVVSIKVDLLVKHIPFVHS
jgi:transcription antitermination factor NusG